MVGTLIRRPLPPVSDFIRTLLDDADATTALATLGVVSGTYTPTLTAVANVDASTAYVAQYTRIGNVVTVAGKFDVDATAAASTSTTLGVSLPVASDFTAVNGQCHGVVAIMGNLGGQIFADITNNRASLFWQSAITTNVSGGFSFMYAVV
jgi:hypothetical protein